MSLKSMGTIDHDNLKVLVIYINLSIFFIYKNFPNLISTILLSNIVFLCYVCKTIFKDVYGL